MNASPFDNLPKITKEEALRILSTPFHQLKLSSDYYKAVYHLSKFPGVETEQALLTLIKSDSTEQSLLIAKRKAVESLAILNSYDALPVIKTCLGSSDTYLVENAAWALAELGCNDLTVNKKILSLLNDEEQNRRVLIQSLAKMRAYPEIQSIKPMLTDQTLPSGVRGAAIAAYSSLCGPTDEIICLKKYLNLPNQNDRQCAIQDIIDADEISLIPSLLKTPVAPSFKLRAINHLWPQGVSFLNSIHLYDILDLLIIDHPSDLDLQSNFHTISCNRLLVEEFFGTDFNRSYFALKQLIKRDSITLWKILLEYWDRAEKDYGALYFFMILFRLVPGWDQNQVKRIEALALSCLDQYWPDYMKFRPAAILTLMTINPIENRKYIPKWLNQTETPFWACRYAALITIQSLTNQNDLDRDKILKEVQNCQKDTHRFVRGKAEVICRFYESG